MAYGMKREVEKLVSYLRCSDPYLRATVWAISVRAVKSTTAMCKYDQ